MLLRLYRLHLPHMPHIHYCMYLTVGIDEPRCLEGVTYCRSLEYVLHNIQETVSWSVFVYDPQAFNHSVNVTTDYDLYNSSLSFVGAEFTPVNFTGFRKLRNFWQVTFENLYIIATPQIEHGALCQV